jgi:hypothetical protein
MMFRVTQRVVVNTVVLIEAASVQAAAESAANWVEETIEKAIKEESGGTDSVNDCEVETTSVTEVENVEAEAKDQPHSYVPSALGGMCNICGRVQNHTIHTA